jgi:hypothetical protein
MAKKSSSSKEPSEDDVRQAQEEWRKAIVDIGRSFVNGEDVVGCATGHIKRLYAYDYGDGEVLFKPTKAVRRPFRPTFEGALSYFVGHALAKADFPEDEGFAIAPFLDVYFSNALILTEDNRAIAMGTYRFLQTDNSTVLVEYTFGYRLTGTGLLIDLHHSSVPYQKK